METLDQERSGMEALIEQTDQEAVDFAKFWQEASLNQRIELKVRRSPGNCTTVRKTTF
jgi:hypothetical protein